MKNVIEYMTFLPRKDVSICSSFLFFKVQGYSRKIIKCFKKIVFTTEISMLLKLTYPMRGLKIILGEMHELVDLREFWK